MTRVIIGFPFEHPIDCLKVQWQAKPYFKNEFEMAKHVYCKKGIIKGFYSGSLPNISRLILRNCYKYPLLVGLPEFYQRRVPNSLNNTSLLKLYTGISLAMIESIITCPIDRIKIYMMTSKYRYQNDQVTRRNVRFHELLSDSPSKFNELFRGFGPLFAR